MELLGRFELPTSSLPSVPDNLFVLLFVHVFFKNSLLSANIYLQIAHHAETGVCTALFAK